MARDYREETNFNAQEWALIRAGADKIGLPKATFLRFAALQVAEKYMREIHEEETDEKAD